MPNADSKHESVCRGNWRNIPISLIDPRPGVLSERPSAIAAEDRSGQSRASSSGRSGCK